jgi:hypothetical protein
MRRQLFISLILLCSTLMLKAQIYTPSGVIQGSSINNNIGIGTIDPGTKLEVNGAASFGQTYYNVLHVSFLESAPAYFYIDTKIPYTDQPAPQIQITGYNYGHANKEVKLTISWYVYNNSFYWSQYKSDLGYYNPSRIRLGTYNDAGTRRVRIEIANDGTYWSSYYISATDRNGISSNYDGWRFTLGTMPVETGDITNVSEYTGIVYTNVGNVLIGKNVQSNTAYKLDVVGKIRADEIVVNTTGADYVFDRDYKLLSLKELEEYIKQNRCLPDIKSASEMQLKGVPVSELQTKLLQKIEELTLYTIRQEKEIDELRKQIQEMKR